MTKLKGILGAGTLTGLVMVTSFVFGMDRSTAVAEPPPYVQPEIIVQPVTTVVEPTADAAMQTYVDQLEVSVLTMQSREAEFQTQIGTANQTIIQLQDQINAATAVQAAPQSVAANPQSGELAYSDDDDSYGEHEAYEEQEEHNEHEDHEEDDD